MADFDVQGARRAGYSDAEIADYLAGQSKFDAGAARKAGYSDKEIVDHLSPPPSAGRQAMNAIGDAADTTYDYLRTLGNKALGGVAAIPRQIVEGVDWIGRMDAAHGGTGARVPDSVKNMLPTAEEATRAMNLPKLPYSAWSAEDIAKLKASRDMNTPRPETSINPVVDAALTGVITAPFTGPASLPGLLANIGGPTVSEVGGQAFKDTPYEGAARLIGAPVGAGLGYALGRTGQYVGNAVGSMRAPFKPEGQDMILGRTLNKQASNPETAAAALENYAPPVPGMNVDIGRASRDSGLMAMSDITPPNISGPLVQKNNKLLTDRLEQVGSSLPPVDQAGSTIQQNLATRRDQLIGARKTATEPLYTEARKFPEDLPVGKLFNYADETIANTKGVPQATMQDARKLLLNAKGQPDFSANGLMNTRNALGPLIESAPDDYTKSLLLTMRSKVDEALSSVPAEAAARAKFAEFSKPLEPFNPDLGQTNRTIAGVVEKDPYGKNFMMPAERVPSTLMKRGDMGAPTIQKLMMASGGDPAVKQAMASAYFDDFKNAISSSTARDAAGNPVLSAAGAEKWLKANRGGAINVLSPDQVKAMETVRDALVEASQQVPGRVNSATYSRLATDNILSAMLGNRLSSLPIPNLIKNTLGLSYDVADEALRNRLFDLIQDPKAAAALMKKATAGNLKMAEPVLLSIGRGTAVGSLGAER